MTGALVGGKSGGGGGGMYVPSRHVELSKSNDEADDAQNSQAATPSKDKDGGSVSKKSKEEAKEEEAGDGRKDREDERPPNGDVDIEANGRGGENGENGDAGDGDGDDKGAEDGREKTRVERYIKEDDTPWIERYMEVVRAYWMLGLIAFGGPQAHVAILRDHLVVQRNWMDEEAFMELFAIGQGLPGPTSTQLVVSTALSHAGPLAGLTAFMFWNLPGFIVLTVCGVLIATFIDPYNPPWYLIGIPPAAISLVFKAFYFFGLKLDRVGTVLALISCLVAILINGDYNIEPTSSQYIYPSMLAFGGIVTYLDSKREKPWGTYKSPSQGWNSRDERTLSRIGISMWMGGFLFFVWAFVLTLVICLKDVAGLDNVYLDIFEVMFRIGSLIFGGGQVVLPMLQTEVVPYWMTKDQFLQGLGLAQAMPGPLFNFSSYLGAVYQKVPGAFVAWMGLFGPGILLIFAIVPFWARLRHMRWFKCVLMGVNATAIGLVGAACVLLYEGTVVTAADSMVFVFALTLAGVFNVQAPFVIIAGLIFGAILSQYAASLGQETYCEKNGFVEVPV